MDGATEHNSRLDQRRYDMMTSHTCPHSSINADFDRYLLCVREKLVELLQVSAAVCTCPSDDAIT